MALSIEQIFTYSGHIAGNLRLAHSKMSPFFFGRFGTTLIFDLKISILFLR